MINLQEPPPRRWIQSTLPEELRHLDDRVLATRMTRDDPLYFLFGSELFRGKRRRNATLRYANGGWAFCVLGRDDQAWKLLSMIERAGPSILRECKTNPVPTASMLVFIYVCLRQGRLEAARLGLQLIERRERTGTQIEDIEMLRRELQRLSPRQT